MSQEVERIATLETKIELLLKDTETVKNDVADIKATLTRQRGFIAGMLTILAPLWGIALYMASRLWEYLFGAANG